MSAPLQMTAMGMHHAQTSMDLTFVCATLDTLGMEITAQISMSVQSTHKTAMAMRPVLILKDHSPVRAA